MSKPNGIKAVALATSIALENIRQHNLIDMSDDKVNSLVEVIQDNLISEFNVADSISVQAGDVLLFKYRSGFHTWQLSLQFHDETEVNVGGCLAEEIEVYDINGQLLGVKKQFTNTALLKNMSSKAHDALNNKRESF